MKGIPFSEPMFHSVIKGMKIQTRRIINPQPDFLSDNYKWAKKYNGEVILPKYGVSDICYIKEPYCQDCEEVEEEHATIRQWNGKYLYKYSGDELKADKYSPFGKWKSPRFMPEDAARYFIEITEVRAENVCEISDEDCFAEGIIANDWECEGSYHCVNSGHVYGWDKQCNHGDGNIEYKTPREAFASLFNEVYGKNAFEQMPWVWVISFRLLDQKP